LAAWNYFIAGRWQTPTYDFIERLGFAYTGKEDAVTNDPMEAHYIAIQHVRGSA